MTIVVITTIFVYGCNKPEEHKDIKSEENIELSKVDNISKAKEDNFLKEKEVLEKNETEELPINESKTIVIDPGHSSVGNSEKEPMAPNSTQTKPKDVLGATGVSSKIPEYVTTVSIGNLLKEELTALGYNIVMTKTEIDESISNIERATIGNENNADLVVRIHADSSESQSAQGASVLVPPVNEYTSDISEISKSYGEKIISTYTNELDIKNRGVIYRDDMTGFNWSEVPVVILEMGFLSNLQDDSFLSNTENHSKIAKAIAKGILECFN